MFSGAMTEDDVEKFVETCCGEVWSTPMSVVISYSFPAYYPTQTASNENAQKIRPQSRRQQLNVADNKQLYYSTTTTTTVQRRRFVR